MTQEYINLIVLGFYLIIVTIVWSKGKTSWFFRLLYWIIGFPFAVVGLVFSILGFIFGVFSSSSSGGEGKCLSKDDNSSRSKSSLREEPANRETVEIQYQQITGRWQTVHVTSNNLDQTISHALNNAERMTARMSGTTGRLRAKGKRSGSIYDIRN